MLQWNGYTGKSKQCNDQWEAISLCHLLIEYQENESLSGLLILKSQRHGLVFLLTYLCTYIIDIYIHIYDLFALLSLQ